MAGTAGGVRAGGAFVEIFTDNNPLVRGLKKAQTMLGGWAKGLRSVGTKIAAPLALAGATGLGALMAMSEQYVAIGSTQRETAGSAAALGLALLRLKSSVQVLSLRIFAFFAPALTMLFNWLARVAVGASRWIAQNKGLITTALWVAAAIGGVGVALIAVGTVLSIAATAVGGFLTLWAGVGAVLGFVLSPVGLVLTALAGITAWFLTSTETGRNAMAWFAEAFGTLAGEATTAWGGLVAAISAGNLQAAFQIAIAFLRLQWVRATNFLESKWLDFKDAFSEIWSQAQGNIAIGFVNTAALLETTWVQVTSFLADAWTAFTTRFMNGWRTAQNFVGKGFAWLIAKMEGLDPDEVMAEMDADLARRNGGASNSADAAIMQREDARKKRLAEIEANRSGAVSEVGNDVDRRRADRERNRSAAATREEEALAEAQRGFANAVKATTNQPGLQDKDFGPGMQRTVQAAAATDVRSQEGLKSLMAAFGGNTDPQAMIVQHTKQAADEAVKQREELEKIRKNQEQPGDDPTSLKQA